MTFHHKDNLTQFDIISIHFYSDQALREAEPTTRDGKLSAVILSFIRIFLGLDFIISPRRSLQPPSLNHSGLISFSTVPCPFSTPSGVYWFEHQQVGGLIVRIV